MATPTFSFSLGSSFTKLYGPRLGTILLLPRSDPSSTSQLQTQLATPTFLTTTSRGVFYGEPASGAFHTMDKCTFRNFVSDSNRMEAEGADLLVYVFLVWSIILLSLHFIQVKTLFTHSWVIHPEGRSSHCPHGIHMMGGRCHPTEMPHYRYILYGV